MLILVAGATGNIGTHVVRSALKRGHQVRALARSPEKLPEDLRNQLESFVKITGPTDIPNLDIGCKGADAVICTYGSDGALMLDGQLALLRAAERAGIKRFHTASWNLVWDKMPLGVLESYDPVISFTRHAALTSPIKPLSVFCGVLASTLFGLPGAGALEGGSAVWTKKDNGERVINLVGEGDVLTPVAVEADVADFSVALTTSDLAEKGGFYQFCSDEFTFQDLAATYKKVRGADCRINTIMSVDACRQAIAKARADAEESGDLYSRWHQYIGLVYGLTFAEGTYNPKPVDASRFPDVPRTSLEEYIRENAWL
ncbi:hypothetical protein M409DRAFT_56826 [Zasmidium cellare ATCC 36951]|uniref:NAD(P)-binding domain-containing protein n=1 Tax=Zasmidium cellare ATCC 36951 TaxID=1080233 RepID=A0A6A6CAC6_ZASCE|nr:uncharacterized protein M409DRAFT_56826 [Zasmidium cellare ATCC 36951]KAF2164114.1 hypothetical protein M409DRAFT_56826 [Zasmidium cellare ATCC 36951]